MSTPKPRSRAAMEEEEEDFDTNIESMLSRHKDRQAKREKERESTRRPSQAQADTGGMDIRTARRQRLEKNNDEVDRWIEQASEDEDESDLPMGVRRGMDHRSRMHDVSAE
eukprot:GHVR01179021.1.p1 GENE.GHVR01179021.1~~GHVR01179021.1.p1  ORF type:complete len:125 (+),score=26.74 GHVR01179021.1:43-375(+)